VENWRKYTIKYTCCKSKFAISKQKGEFQLSYDTNQTIWIGYNFSILNIKKNNAYLFCAFYKVLIYNVFYNDMYVPSKQAVEGSNPSLS
jgi:hypothetical protein